MSNGWVYIHYYVSKIHKILLKKALERPPYWKTLELARRLWGAINSGHVGIEWSHSDALICLMAGSTYRVICVKYTKYRL